ncbi:MAG: hypothetical protein ACI9ST_000238 [Psychrobacter glaciei]
MELATPNVFKGAISRLPLVSTSLGAALATVWVVACFASPPQNLPITTRPNRQYTATVGAKPRLKFIIYNSRKVLLGANR